MPAQLGQDRSIAPASPAGRGQRDGGLAAALPAVTAALPAVTAALAGRAAQHDRDGSFPADGIAEVHAAGLLTATITARHGGPGAGLAQTAAILRALGQGDPSVALISAMTLFAHALQGRQPTWPDALYAGAVAEAATRPVLINALRVEPELGTPARGGLPATVAHRVPGGWSLTGRKIFSTGAAGLRWMVVWARTDEEPARVGGFIVAAGSPGITIEPTWDHLGLRASRGDDVIFAATPVPDGQVAGLAEPGAGRPPAAFMAWNCLGITSIYLGVAAAAREWLTTFLTERTPAGLGRPLATLPRFQSAVGEITAGLAAADDLVAGLAERVDVGDPAAAQHAGFAKLAGTRAAIGAVEQAVALIGNNALTRRNPLERHYRDVLCARVHTPQDDSILAEAGRSAFAASGFAV
jgi:alkylation response protein AidB-like acyl-CoA dehydrogenase